ncbi:replication initiation protein [Enterobacter hormaechei]|uniref:plasmid replication initiator RepA n=1 Tax=Enterobacter hormaechei TaxID=158836 RepID=UPI000627E1D9|nr:plasmid replication initiator RepA [Enterobacter hormaechei]KKJ19530.1 replication initiation protein [Enterobacter hormaechei subsp. hoffmannii]SAG81862.1 replication initiation protein [Enterobacter hormaechei]
MTEQQKHTGAVLHWSQLSTNDQIRFWQDVDNGGASSFLTPAGKKLTRRRRGEHSTKPKCENPLWFRPARYKALGGQLGRAYNRLVRKDPETGEHSLRMHMSLHPFYVQKRRQAGRKYAFRPEKQRLLDALWPVLISFCDAGKHTVGMCISRLARELSPKDAKGNVIAGTEVTVSRLSNLIAEQVRFGVLGVSEQTSWDKESRKRLPKYVWITPVGWQLLGVDMDKLIEQQVRKLRECEERRALIRDGIIREDEEISVHAARKRWYAQRTLEALRYRRQKGAARKRANRLARLPKDQQIHEMAEFLRKTMPADELYWCSDDRLQKLAVDHLYQLQLSLTAPPPH